MKTPAIKILAAAAALFLGTTGAQATVTLVFGTTTTYASNWGDNQAGTGNSKLVWGILIDTSGNGFLPAFDGYSYTGLNLTAGVYQPMNNNINEQATDDLLFLSPALMTTVPNPLDSGVVGQNRITGISGVPIGINGVDSGDRFAIVWFDRTSLTGTSMIGIHFGIFENAAFTMPADSSTFPYNSVFTGADALKPMTGRIAPEPSTLLLSALGALALIRRRR